MTAGSIVTICEVIQLWAYIGILHTGT